MDFWHLISENCPKPLTVADASHRLESALQDLPEQDILAFCRAFDERMNEAYSWDLWGMAYLINGGCGDDAFMDFRAALISMGPETFDSAMGDAESLLTLDGGQLQELFEEGMLYCGPNAYEAVAGKHPETGVVHAADPSGQPWEESRESLAARYPRAWGRYGWDAPEASSEKKPWWKFW